MLNEKQKKMVDNLNTLITNIITIHPATNMRIGKISLGPIHSYFQKGHLIDEKEGIHNTMPYSEKNNQWKKFFDNYSKVYGDTGCGNGRENFTNISKEFNGSKPILILNGIEISHQFNNKLYSYTSEHIKIKFFNNIITIDSEGNLESNREEIAHYNSTYTIQDSEYNELKNTVTIYSKGNLKDSNQEVTEHSSIDTFHKIKFKESHDQGNWTVWDFFSPEIKNTLTKDISNDDANKEVVGASPDNWIEADL